MAQTYYSLALIFKLAYIFYLRVATWFRAFYLIFYMSCFLGGWLAPPRLCPSSPMSLLEFPAWFYPDLPYLPTNESNTCSQLKYIAQQSLILFFSYT